MSRFALPALAALCLVGCAAAGQSRALPRDGDALAQARFVALRASPARVIYLGETHDNPAHHAYQTHVLAALLDSGARPALAFEMLTQDQQHEMDLAMADGLAGAALDRQLKWTQRGWPGFAMYQPLFDLAARYGLPVIAADLDQATVRRITKEGLGTLAEPERDRLSSRLPDDAAREARIERDVMDAHCGMLPRAGVPRMVEAWHARNVAMARRIAAGLDGGGQIVVIIGRGHQAPGGLPDQLEALRPGTRQFVVDFTEEGDTEPTSEPGPEHFTWLTAGVERGDPCAALERQR